MPTNAEFSIHSTRFFIFSLIGVLFLAGCTSVRGYQAPLDFDAALLEKPTCLTGENPAVDAACRNQFIDHYVIKSSINFSSFVRDLTGDRNTSGLIIDNLRTGVAAAITVVGGAGPKTALGGAALGLAGLQGSIDKRLFYETTVPALVKFMDAKRSLILAEILIGRSQKIDRYPFSLAIRDLQRFNDAGSITDAISSVAAEGAKQAKEAEAAIINIVQAGTPPPISTINSIAALSAFIKTTGNLSDPDLQKYATIIGIKGATGKDRSNILNEISIILAGVYTPEALEIYLKPFRTGGLSNLKDSFNKFYNNDIYLRELDGYADSQFFDKEVSKKDTFTKMAACWGVPPATTGPATFELIMAKVKAPGTPNTLFVTCRQELNEKLQK